MTWLLPSSLAIGGIAAAVVIALHFIARSRPLAEPLPTARFIPQRPIHARARSIALTDVPLLLIRVAAVLLLAAAIAAPVLAAARGRVARVIVADRSRDVVNIQEVRDSVRALFRGGDALVAFDTDAAVVGSIDSLKSIDATGSLSTGLAAAVRAGAALATHADSVELVIVSPLSAAEVDQATSRIRALWPGRARIVRIASRFSRAEILRSARDDRALRVMTAATLDDPLVAGLSLMGVTAAGGTTRLVRTRVSSSDTAWARDSGHVLIHWPSADENAHWPKRATIDAIGGVASSGGVLVARFPRLWYIEGRAIARWADGEAAAVERTMGNGCIRDVAIVFDPASDVTLRSTFGDFVRPLLEPCGGMREAAADSTSVMRIAGAGRLASSDALRDRASETSRWTPWLLIAVAALLTLELAMRRSTKALA